MRGADDAVVSQSDKLAILLYPLDVCYAAAGRALPHLQPLDGARMPQPYRSLLVHQNDMTPTLEKFHAELLRLRVLSTDLSGDQYTREVVLFTDKRKRPVEYGAIRINLGLFEASAREDILQGRRPLGRVLKEQKVEHLSRPKGFFSVEADELIGSALELPAEARGKLLYGRRNTLTTLDGHALAEIVEILPP